MSNLLTSTIANNIPATELPDFTKYQISAAAKQNLIANSNRRGPNRSRGIEEADLSTIRWQGAYCYLRVSTKYQNVENQRLDLQRLSERLKIPILGWFEDISFTGGAAAKSRPNFKKLMETIKPCQVIFCVAVARLGRNALDSLNIVNELSHRKIRVVSTHQDLLGGFDSADPRNRNLIGIIAFLAQNERQLTSDRTRASVETRRAAGHHIGLNRYGTCFNPDHKLEEEPQARAIINVIVELRRSGVSIGKICEHLRDIGAPTPREQHLILRCRKHNLPIPADMSHDWSSAAVRRILKGEMDDRELRRLDLRRRVTDTNIDDGQDSNIDESTGDDDENDGEDETEEQQSQKILAAMNAMSNNNNPTNSSLTTHRQQQQQPQQQQQQQQPPPQQPSAMKPPRQPTQPLQPPQPPVQQVVQQPPIQQTHPVNQPAAPQIHQVAQQPQSQIQPPQAPVQQVMQQQPPQEQTSSYDGLSDLQLKIRFQKRKDDLAKIGSTLEEVVRLPRAEMIATLELMDMI